MNNTKTESARGGVSFTPGPWEFIYGSVYKQDGRAFNEDGLRIAKMDRDEPRTTPCERDANARLIAAAPELLEACKSALDGLYSYRDIDGNCSAMTERDKLIAAIAKAEGRQ